jgi:hypothetical protein
MVTTQTENPMKNHSPSRASNFRRAAVFALGAALVSLTQACRWPEAIEIEDGALELVVAGTTANGVDYRLRGNFTLQGLNSPLLSVVSTADEPAATSLHRQVPPGLYSVSLNPGFQVDRMDVTLLTRDPLIVMVEPGKVTRIPVRISSPPPAAQDSRLAQW